MLPHRVGARSLAGLIGAGVLLAWGSGLLLGTGRLSWGIALGALAALCAVHAFGRRDGAPTVAAVIPVWERVRQEIERARRHNGSVVVARLPFGPSAAGNHHTLAAQAELVLRESDSVWVENRSVLLLLAETDRTSAQAGIDRVVQHLDGKVADSVVASFPEDELTLGGLVDRLYPPRRVRPMSGAGVQPGGVPVLNVDTERQATA